MDLSYLLLGGVIAFLITYNNADVSDLIKNVNDNLPPLQNEETEAKWQNEISNTKDLERIKNAKNNINQFLNSIAVDVAKYKRENFEDKNQQRQVSLIPLGYEVLSGKELNEIESFSNGFVNIVKNTKLCSYQDPSRCDLTFEPQVKRIAFASNNPEEVKFYWLEWRRKAGAAVRENFNNFAEIYRKAAEKNGFSRSSDFWLKGFGESGSIVLENLGKIISQLDPLFKQAHAYIRGIMRLKYGSEVIEINKPVPQHLYLPFLQKAFISGVNVALPFSANKLPNITDILLNKKLTAHDNFLIAVEFFKSLGMPQLEESYWQENAKPKANLRGRDQIHKAWKYYGPADVKFSYSPVIKESTFFNMFEAVSDIYYYKAYKNQESALYQTEPAAKINDALGKFFSLAASSPKYLEKLGIKYSEYKTKGARINRLYAKGLRSIFSIAIHYAVERYRLNALDQVIDIDDNCAYWDQAESLYGVQPPVSRSKTDFDASGILRIKLDEEHTSFIYTTVLQYQLFEHFCALTGEYENGNDAKPLDLCDLSEHHNVAEKINQAMALGASVSLKDFLKILTDSEELNISGLLEYYRPLHEWLVEENQARNNEVGWEKSNKCQS